MSRSSLCASIDRVPNKAENRLQCLFLGVDRKFTARPQNDAFGPIADLHMLAFFVVFVVAEMSPLRTTMAYRYHLKGLDLCFPARTQRRSISSHWAMTGFMARKAPLIAPADEPAMSCG